MFYKNLAEKYRSYILKRISGVITRKQLNLEGARMHEKVSLKCKFDMSEEMS